MVPAFDHDLGRAGPGIFPVLRVRFPVQDAVLRAVDQQSLQFIAQPLRGIRAEQHDPVQGAAVFSRVVGGRDAAQRVSAHIPVVVMVLVHDLIRLPDRRKSKAQRYFDQAGVHARRSQPVQQRRIGRFLHFSSRIENEGPFLRRPVKIPPIPGLFNTHAAVRVQSFRGSRVRMVIIPDISGRAARKQQDHCKQYDPSSLSSHSGPSYPSDLSLNLRSLSNYLPRPRPARSAAHRPPCSPSCRR